MIQCGSVAFCCGLTIIHVDQFGSFCLRERSAGDCISKFNVDVLCDAVSYDVACCYGNSYGFHWSVVICIDGSLVGTSVWAV